MLNSIFEGVPPSGSRTVLAELIRQGDFEKAIVPCVGRFGIVETMVGAGIEPKGIETSDISIFSSLLGYYTTEQNMKDLGIQTEFEFVPDPTDDHYAASVLLAIKIAQTVPKTYYAAQIKKDLIVNADRHIEKLQTEIDTLKERIIGIKYEIKDMWNVFENVEDNETTLLYVNPPAYRGGYTRMFDVEGISWNVPSTLEFDPDDYTRMLEMLQGLNVTVVAYRYQSLDLVPERGWTPFYARKYAQFGSIRMDYLVTNKPPSFFHIERLRSPIPKNYNYPILNPGDRITIDSKIGFVVAPKEVVLYYRDLFVHRLGATQAEKHYLAIVDGKVFGALGLMTNFLDRRAMGFVVEWFGITAHSNKYKSLNRLFMMLITCQEFKTTHLSSSQVWDCHKLVTTCLAKGQRVKINDGILEITDKKQLKNGMWQIRYETEFYEKSYTDCVKEWLDYEYKRGEYERNYGKKKKKIRASTRSR